MPHSESTFSATRESYRRSKQVMARAIGAADSPTFICALGPELSIVGVGWVGGPAARQRLLNTMAASVTADRIGLCTEAYHCRRHDAPASLAAAFSEGDGDIQEVVLYIWADDEHLSAIRQPFRYEHDTVVFEHEVPDGDAALAFGDALIVALDTARRSVEEMPMRVATKAAAGHRILTEEFPDWTFYVVGPDTHIGIYN